MSSEPQRFVFAPLERRGVVAGLTAAQLALLSGGVLAGTAIFRAVPNAAGLALAAMALLAATCCAFVPVQGRAASAWVPTLARRAVRIAQGAHRTRALPGALTVPRAFIGLEFDEIEQLGTHPVGVVRDRRSGSVTAIVPVRGRSFALLDAADKERRLGAWAGVLAALSREQSPVRSVQWVERTVPGDAETLVRHFDAARAVAPSDPASGSYAALIAEAGPLGQDHECFVALTVGGRRVREPDAALSREVRLLRGQLVAAELAADRALDRDEIGALVRTAFDPCARLVLSQRATVDGGASGCPPDTAWPSATEEHWGAWRTDDSWHASFWIAEWPRTEVGPDFLAPMLLHTAVQRSVSVIMSPLPFAAGIREAEAARTAHVADEQLRANAGFLTTARHRREAEGIARREAELSDGHAAYRFSGYVTVTAATAEQLEVACGQIVQASHQTRLSLRRLHGLQDLAFTWTLPFGRGLAR